LGGGQDCELKKQIVMDVVAEVKAELRIGLSKSEMGD
jgi:hypothetical protein